MREARRAACSGASVTVINRLHRPPGFPANLFENFSALACYENFRRRPLLTKGG
jgi:hypothetical protein